jgi:hypothetical protein
MNRGVGTLILIIAGVWLFYYVGALAHDGYKANELARKMSCEIWKDRETGALSTEQDIWTHRAAP